ncbi:MAG: ankyrin and ring finger domain protein, partial [Harvfovirus sp.]
MTANNKMYSELLEAFTNPQKTFDNVNGISMDDDMRKWIEGTDTKPCEYENLNFDTIWDLASKIINAIPNELQSEREISAFINEFTAVTTNINTYTITNNLSWEIDLEEKFKWIAMMLATRSCHKVIAYIVKIIKDTEYVLKLQDLHGNNCFIMASNNIPALFELINLFPKKDYINGLTSLNKHNFSALEILTYTGGIVQLLESKIMTFDVCSYVNSYSKMTIMHIAALGDNVGILEFLLNWGKISASLMSSADKNGNTPLLLACTYDLPKHIKAMMSSNLYGSEVISFKNAAGLSPLNLITTPDNANFFLDLLDEKTFQEYKFENFLKNDPIFQKFVHSKLFTYTLVESLIMKLLFKKLSFLVYVLEVTNSEVVDVMKNIFLRHKYLLAYSFDIGHKYSRAIIKSKYMSSELFVQVFAEQSLLSKLVAVGGDSLETKELTQAIIESQHMTREAITENFIEFCAKNFCFLIVKLVERGFVDNMISAINSMCKVENAKAIITLFENNKIDRDLLTKENALIKKLLLLDSNILDWFLKEDVFAENIINIFTRGGSGIIDVYSVFENGISVGSWGLLLGNRALTSERL